jgi:hypothetical protein
MRACFSIPAGILGGGLLAYGVIVFFLTWFKPDHALLAFSDIESGLGRQVGLVLLSLGGALWFGVARKHPWVVRIIFALGVFPALSQTAQEIFLWVRRGH